MFYVDLYTIIIILLVILKNFTNDKKSVSRFDN